jgi:hypothetical protein
MTFRLISIFIQYMILQKNSRVGRVVGYGPEFDPRSRYVFVVINSFVFPF